MFRPDLPEPIERLVLMLLERSPARRPASATEVEAALAQLARSGFRADPGGPATLRPSGADPRERRRALREAAFRAVAELAAEPPPPLPAALDPAAPPPAPRVAAAGPPPFEPAAIAGAAFSPGAGGPLLPVPLPSGGLARFRAREDESARRSRTIRGVVVAGVAILAGLVAALQLRTSRPGAREPGEAPADPPVRSSSTEGR
jgi:hypothetical protein